MSATASPNPPPDSSDSSANFPLEWHPGIRALGWVIGWSILALCSAIVWEFLTLHTINVFKRPALTGALAGWILAGLWMLLLLESIFELWWATTRYMRDQYPGGTSTRVNFVISLIFVVLAVPILWCFKWALDLIWQSLHVWASRMPADVHVKTGPPVLEWPLVLFLSAASIGSGWILFRQFVATVNRYRSAVRCLGIRGALKGMLYMSIFRLRQPRRDFFVQAPVISDMPWWALCAALQVVLTGSIFAWVLPIPLFGISLEYAATKVAPAVRLFLGTSESDSFRVFHALRYAWRWFNVVTLLDRESDAGLAAYYVEFRDSAIRNPRAVRIWSLRTRPNFWIQTVEKLIDLVAVVVVDVRTGSQPVQYELGLLSQPGRVEKTWLLVGEDRSAPALMAVQGEDKECWFPSKRFVTEEMLYRATLGRDGLRIDSEAP